MPLPPGVQHPMPHSPALNGTPNGVSAPHPAAAGAAGAAAAAGGVSAEVLERWAEAYGQLVEDAAELGVPRRWGRQGGGGGRGVSVVAWWGVAWGYRGLATGDGVGAVRLVLCVCVR